MQVTLERELEYWAPGATQAVPVWVRIDEPKPHPEHDWECAYTIEGLPREPHYSRPMTGIDAIDALSYALAIVPLVLRLMTPHEGRLLWRGSEDLRFPSRFSAPTQDWRWTPSQGGEERKLAIRIGLPERTDDQWSVLVTCTDCTTWEAMERRIGASAWPEVLERAAAAVLPLLQAQAATLGGGTLEEVHEGPSCAIAREE